MHDQSSTPCSACAERPAAAGADRCRPCLYAAARAIHERHGDPAGGPYGLLADLDAAVSATPRDAGGHLILEADPAALHAVRLFGHDRPHRMTGAADLECQAEYAELRMLEAERGGNGHLTQYFAGWLDALREELESRRTLATTIRAARRLTPAMLERIKNGAPCQEFIQWGGRVGLQPHPRYSPRYWVGLCPFHSERTPSFVVWPDGWKCFGCGEMGDAFEYARRFVPGHEFMEAVRAVAAYGGIALESPTASGGTDLGELYRNRP